MGRQVEWMPWLVTFEECLLLRQIGPALLLLLLLPLQLLMEELE